MSARRAFLLGAVVGAGVLAAVGAVSATSSGSAAPASVRLHADAPPDALYTDLKDIDSLLTRLIKDESNGDGLGSHQLVERVNEIKKKKQAMVNAFFGEEVSARSSASSTASTTCSVWGSGRGSATAA